MAQISRDAREGMPTTSLSKLRHGPEPAQSRVLSCPVVSARFLLYSNWIFFVSSCDLVYPPGSLNA
jgi:hypothetical protein